MTGYPSTPLVSVVMPAYNAARWIERALGSIFRQTYPRIEVIVIDDGSTDDTAAVVEDICRAHPLRLLRRPNGGQGAARNAGIVASYGQYITFLDADDFYRPAKIQKEVEYLETNPQHGLVYCRVAVAFEDKPDRFLEMRGALPVGDTFREQLRGSLVNPNSVMVRRQLLTPELMFREGMAGRYAEDWDLCLRLAKSGIRFGLVEEPLVVVSGERTGSNTTWESQYLIKRTVVEMLESLFSDMDSRRRHELGAAGILRKNRLKLAIACLARSNKREFAATLRRAVPWPLAAVLQLGVALVPAPWLRRAVISAWRIRRRRLVYVAL